MEDRELMVRLFRRLSKIDYVKPGDIPQIDLYMDQVTTFMNNHLENSKRYEEDKILTKTMINNYAKNNLLPPPEKKKYSRDHMLLLTLIYYYKNLLSIGDIETLLGPLKEEYFGKKERPNLEDFYEKIFNMCRSQSKRYVKEILTAYREACKTFPDEEHTEESKYDQDFAFLCLLGFDVHLKKVIMETMVDEMREKEEKNKGTKKK